MGHWRFDQAGAKAENKAAEKLVQQTLECFGIDFSEPCWESQTRSSGRYFPSIAGSGSLDNEELVFSILNRLFGKVWLYSESETGSSVSDYYQRSEYVYDPEEMKCYNFEVNYCYGDNTAFGEEIEYDESGETDVSDFGTRKDEWDVKFYVTQEAKDVLIGESTSRGYTELTAMILEKLTVDESKQALL